MEKTLYLPEAGGTALFAFVGSPWGLLTAWLAVVNLVTFLIFGLDKRRARRKARRPSVRRVPERTLLLLAALGGSVGALLGMVLFRHKTLHAAFRFGVPAILLLQLLAALWLLLR